MELEQDLANTMTPEELAAINDQEAISEEEKIALQKIAGGNDDDDDDDDGSDDDNDDAGAGAGADAGAGDANDDAASDGKADDNSNAAAAAAENLQQKDESGQTVNDDTDDDDFSPQYKASLPEDFNQRMQSVNEREQKLWDDFENGEVDRTALQKGLAEVNEERSQLNDIKVKASISEEMNQQASEQAWANAVVKFASRVAETDGIDYWTDKQKQADLDLFVVRLANDPENNDKPNSWFLQEAHKRVKALHGIVDTSKQQEPPKKDNTKPQTRKPAVDSLPKTLAGVPGSDGPGDLAGEFADLDRLEGTDLEDAIAKMTEAQRERYMAGR